MNKTQVLAGAGIVAGIFVIAAIALQGSTMTTASTLDEIIRNGDCLGLEAWEEVHSFDDDLNLTDEQRSEGVKLSMKCMDDAKKSVFESP
ncbi:MAG: hypothetical protein K5798_03755 [Nitrosopumilus sp.]|uniref:hypothetical protein n=1 Tax=Nitrosopumilus sp. TaxID=2024843 RepID=UPI0024331809|nr:hypothetical protein [Nitrosopumilus sp.]MCV0366367.1 hypothetical protein [Nitrosopumilus sp.]